MKTPREFWRSSMFMPILWSVLVLHGQNASADVSTSGLVGYYALDGNVTDSSGRGYNGSVFSAVPADNGKRGGCYEFDGNANAIVVYDTALKNEFPAGSPITISAWVKVRTYHSSLTVIAAMDTGRWIQTRASIRLNEFGVPYYYGQTDFPPPLLSTLGPLSTNQWHLVTGVQSGTVARLYVDGQLAVESLTYSPMQGPSPPQSRFIYTPPYADISVSASIGAWTDWWSAPESTFNGWIDEVRFYKRALSDAEISELWSGNSTGLSFVVANARGNASPTNGTYSYVTGAVVSASVSDSITVGTTRYVCTGATVGGNGYNSSGLTNVTLTLTNNATLTWNWQVQYQLTTNVNGDGSIIGGAGWQNSGSQVALKAIATTNNHFIRWSGDLNGCAIVGNVVTATMTQARSISAVFASGQSSTLTEGLVAYYPLDGNLFDASGNGFHGSNFSATAVTDVVKGDCYQFNGSSTAIVVYDTALKNMFPAAGSVTISAWVQVRAWNNMGHTVIAAMDSGRIIQTRASIRLNATGVPYFYSHGDDSARLLSAFGALTTNQWHLVTGVQTGTVARLYIDGQLAGENLNYPLLMAPSSPTFRAIFTPPYADISVSASIGAWTDWWEVPESTFNGRIDEVRYYNRGLTATEVNDLYNLTARFASLTVANGRDGANPTNGVHTFAAGTPVSATVLSPVVCGSTQYVCMGATVTGNAFNAISSTNITLVLTNDAR